MKKCSHLEPEHLIFGLGTVQGFRLGFPFRVFSLGFKLILEY